MKNKSIYMFKKLIIAAVLFATVNVFAQAPDRSFYKGALVFDLNFGLDVYSVKQHYAIKGTNYSKDTTNAAGSHGPNLSLQYGVLNWLGIGLKYKYDTYFTSADKYTHIRPSVFGQEVGLVLDAHPVRVKHFDLITGVDIGHSSLVFHTHDQWGTEIYGSGSWFNVHVIPRLYFGRFGLNLTMSLPFIKYPNMTTSSDHLNTVFFSSWKASGFGLGWGVSFRFFKPRP
ncbi:MAG: hypothetical protein ACXVC2_08425 [Bacteroidia bacterium]